MKIHEITMEYKELPSVIALLESMPFYWVIITVTLGVFIVISAKLWHLHSLPKYASKGTAQGKVVFWMTALGLFYKPLWIIAVITVLVDWDAIQRWIKETR
ncbi:Mg2+ and Co2+ transporter [Vibrio crassostreae]|nr:Mg2+ and Co2+ transporter [Vibrio crassostreae]